jgi:hypothetical protein
VPVICTIADSSKVIHTFPGQKTNKERKEGGKEGRREGMIFHA